MLKKLLYAILVLVVLVVAGGLIMYNMPAENVASKSVDYTITATELFTEYEADEKAGNTKYIDKIVQVSGKIEDMETDAKGAKVVLIGGNEMGNGVLCTLDKSEESKAAQLKVGDKVSIKGRCTGMLMDVVLNKCTIQ